MLDRVNELLTRYLRGRRSLSEYEAFLLAKERGELDLRTSQEKFSDKLEGILSKEEERVAELREELDRKREEASKLAKIREAKLEQERLYDTLSEYGVKRFRITRKTALILVLVLVFVLLIVRGC